VICQEFQNVVKLPNLHSRAFKYSLPNLRRPSLPLKLGICLQSHVPEFTKLKNMLPKSPDFNFTNYSVLGHSNRWRVHKILQTDQLNRVLIEYWAQLILDILTSAINQLSGRQYRHCLAIPVFRYSRKANITITL